MKTGTFSSLQSFAAEIERRAAAKEDLVTSTEHCKLVPAGEKGVDVVVAGERRYNINSTGHQQIAETVDIPYKYYTRMLSEKQEMLCNDVNEWFRHNPQSRMLRTLDGKLRAVRSDKFRTDLEYEDLAAAVLPVLMDLDVAISSYELTEKRMYIKAVDKRVERELQAKGGNFGDGKHVIVRCLSPAITISDSEVGFGSASVVGGVYDGFCSNLAWFGERSMRKYHVGAKHELAGGANYALLTDETRQKTAVATQAQIRDVVKAAFDQAKFDSLCNKIAETQDQKIDKDADIVKVVSMTSKKLKLTEDEGKGVLRHLAEGGDLSRFGLYNAVTRMSADVDDYDRATELERVGAEIIDLPQSEWEVIKRAA